MYMACFWLSREFLLFQYPSVNLSLETGIFQAFSSVIKPFTVWMFCVSDRGRALIQTEKIAYKYEIIEIF